MSANEKWTTAETWEVRKPAVSHTGGLVTSQHWAASAVGARVLAEGGNAIDAAVATSLMLGTVEPWMSGLGGGGAMLYYDVATDRTHSIEFGMRTPLGAHPEDYPIVEGKDSDLFGWPAVLEDRNVQGPYSIAVPGYLAGIAAALDRFGSRSFSDLITPAIDSAREGMTIDWYATLKIAAAARTLKQFPESAETYLPEGFAPAGEWGGAMPRIALGKLSQTLEALRERGPEDFYDGETGAGICADLNAIGSSVRAADLATYKPLFAEADEQAYRDAAVFAAPGMTAGPTLRDTLGRLEKQWKPGQRPDTATFSAYAGSLQEAYDVRLETMGDVDDSAAPACTSHLSVLDNTGNMVTLTQTLLSVFGSKVMLPKSGILMNNGMMWSDPRPGRPNSMVPGKRPISNMCPTLLRAGSGERYALGASGGRRIMPAVMQLISFVVDYGMDVEEAMHHGRIDVSGAPIVSVDEKLGADVVEKLGSSYKVVRVPNGVYPALLACPSMLCNGKNGQNSGAAYVMSPWAAVAAEG